MLIVEDDADARELYACCMRAAGWEVATATNGVDAIGIAAAIEPHVIVMDIDMPRLDGIEATRRLRSSRQTADIPVVACTASGRDRVSELEQVGFDELVAKPCTAEELCRVVEKLIAAR